MKLPCGSVQKLVVGSPKRNKLRQRGWEGLFPYYAGYPEDFATAILRSAALPSQASVLDPWNGSGTTTAAAASLGLNAMGFDLNPVMVVVARARMLPRSEADSLKPLAATILQRARYQPYEVSDADPLQQWFSRDAATSIRGIEEGLRTTLVGDQTTTSAGIRLDRLSGTAAILYVALFNACRSLAAQFKSSNPTWTRVARTEAEKVNPSPLQIVRQFNESVRLMATSLAEKQASLIPSLAEQSWSISPGDATSLNLAPNTVDFVLTSPPYCTRIDYTSATRIELAVLSPLVDIEVRDLARRMIGSTLSPQHQLQVQSNWGSTCAEFLTKVATHASKASATYYLQTHLDYFDKMFRSLKNISRCMKKDGIFVMVVQDSYYKEVHNDLPTILGEMASHVGLRLDRRDVFENQRTMSRIHPGSKIYIRKTVEAESVLCFSKEP